MQGGYLSWWCLSCCGLFRSGWDVVPKLLLLDFILSKLSIFLCCWYLPPLPMFLSVPGCVKFGNAALVHSQSLMVIPGTFSLGRKWRVQGGGYMSERLCRGISLCREVWGYPRFLWEAPWLSCALFQKWPQAQLPLVVFDLQPFVWGCKGGKRELQEGRSCREP